MALEASRVVRTAVRVDERSGVYRLGSGYVIADGVVLTAAHVLGREEGAAPEDGQAVEVLALDGGGWRPGSVAWIDASLDVAAISCPGCRAPGPVRWGKLAGSHPLEWSAVGFPAASSSDREGRQPEQVYGRTSPISERPSGRLALTVESRQARGGESPWGGLSGAAVFSREHLIGVITADAGAYEASLIGRRAEAFAGSPQLSRVLGDTPVIEEVAEGSYVTVFQSFTESTSPVAAHIRTAQFRALVDERTTGFVGREFVFDEVTRLLGGADFASGYVVISGEPGIGKSALAASLVVRGGYVHHFNIAPENIRSPRQFLENVCAQLIVRYGLAHPVLPPQAGEDAGFLSQLLAEAADAARRRGELPVVVVIDALDEAEDTEQATSANRLYLPGILPEGVFFVVTTREEADYRLDVDHAAEIWIRDDDPANQRDVARYIETFIEAHADAMRTRIAEWDLSPAGFVTAMTALSEGNFMYLVHVLPAIAQGRLCKETVGGIDRLPRGLERYYQRHWRDMKDADPERFTAIQRPVLCFLAISREPVTVPQLMEWTRLEPGDIRRVIGEWREFLNEDLGTKPPRYRIYHRSFAEFLDDQENLRWYHAQIADTALAKIPGFFDAQG